MITTDDDDDAPDVKLSQKFLSNKVNDVKRLRDLDTIIPLNKTLQQKKKRCARPPDKEGCVILNTIIPLNKTFSGIFNFC